MRITKTIIILLLVLLTVACSTVCCNYKILDSTAILEENVELSSFAKNETKAIMPNNPILKIKPGIAVANMAAEQVEKINEIEKLKKSQANAQILKSSRLSHPAEQYNNPMDELANQLHNANMVFSIPKTANLEDDIDAELIIDYKKAIQELLSKIDNSGYVLSNNIKVSKTISAKIIAPNFEINNITPERQALSQAEETQWLWTLTPKEPGKHEVSLSIIAHIKVDNELVERQIQTFNETIIIEVTTKQKIMMWFYTNWEWFISTLIIPLLMWIWKIRQRDKNGGE